MIKKGEKAPKKVLLSFHPLAWTDVCAKQMLSLEKIKKNLKIKSTKLLSDFWPHGKVAKKYGIFSKSQGKVSFVKKYKISQVPDIKEIIKELSNIMHQQESR